MAGKAAETQQASRIRVQTAVCLLHFCGCFVRACCVDLFSPVVDRFGAIFNVGRYHQDSAGALHDPTHLFLQAWGMFAAVWRGLPQVVLSVCGR